MGFSGPKKPTYRQSRLSNSSFGRHETLDGDLVGSLAHGAGVVPGLQRSSVSMLTPNAFSILSAISGDIAALVVMIGFGWRVF
jgi:hypothetical protein